MRFFKQAERPAGVYRLAAAVAGAIVVVAAVLAGDSALPHSQELSAADEALITPGPADLIASGKLGNASWQVIFRPSGPIGQEPDLMCYYALGQAFEATSIACGPFPRTPPKPFTWARPDPAWFDSVGEEQMQVGLGVVGADITSIMLRLDDGQRLKLVPVERYGYRVVAFVIPARVGIAVATAYLNNGQYATTIPSNNNGLSFFSSWLWHGPRGH